MKKIIVTVKKIIGDSKCPRGFKKGEVFIIDNGKTPKGMCASAFNSLWPYIRCLAITGNKKEECSIICPDGIVEYEIKLKN